MDITYFKQEGSSTCSLAALRMALSGYGVVVSEKELFEKVKEDYGKNFKNIWNPTIAKLACEYGVKTEMWALWPLFKKENLEQALLEYEKNPDKVNVHKYENKNDKDTVAESLPLAYKEMFKAINVGCRVHYGSLTSEKIIDLLSNGYLVQTSIKLHLLYPGKKHVYHSILLYGIKDNKVFYHDPLYGEALVVDLDRLEKAAMDVGACIIYK